MNPSTSGPRSDECLLHRHSPGLGWQLVNQIALDAARRLVYTDSDHLDGVRVLGVGQRPLYLRSRRMDNEGGQMGASELWQ